MGIAPLHAILRTTFQAGAQLGPVPVWHPQHALPFQHRQEFGRPAQHFPAWLTRGGAVLVAQGRDHLLRQPLPHAAILRMEELNQRRVYRRFADQQLIDKIAAAIAHPGATDNASRSATA